MTIQLKQFHWAWPLLRYLATLVALLGLTLFIGGLYLAFAERFASIEFSLFGTEFSSSSIGVAMVFIGAALVVVVYRRILGIVDRSVASGGVGGNAEVIGDGEAQGGKGGNSGPFGPGGDGGNARVVGSGSGKATGGEGGNGK